MSGRSVDTAPPHPPTGMTSRDPTLPVGHALDRFRSFVVGGRFALFVLSMAPTSLLAFSLSISTSSSSSAYSMTRCLP